MMFASKSREIPISRKIMYTGNFPYPRYFLYPGSFSYHGKFPYPIKYSMHQSLIFSDINIFYKHRLSVINDSLYVPYPFLVQSHL